MSKIKNVGLDQYGAESFEQQQFGTAGVEEVKVGRTRTGFRNSQSRPGASKSFIEETFFTKNNVRESGSQCNG